MSFNYEYKKKDIVQMKRYTYALKYNVDFDFQIEQKNTFKSIEISYPTIKNKTNNDVEYEYNRRNLSTTYKPVDQFDSVDIEIWTACYMNNLHKEINKYESSHGKVDLELSKEFNSFINRENSLINQEKIYIKGANSLGLTQVIDSITSAIEVASLVPKQEVLYLDDALLGLKGLSYAIKERNGIITNKDKVGAALDFMFYIAKKSTKDEQIKKQLKVTSTVIGLCLEYFIGNK